MNLDVVIPAKTCSKRVTNKNWRAFSGSKSLVDIAIERVIRAGVDPWRIWISCEDESKRKEVFFRWGVHFLPRSAHLCENETPLTEWIRTICCDVPGDSDIAWVQVCDPLFDEHVEVFKRWPFVRGQDGVDSLVVARPWKGYLMTDRFQPVGWSFGEHHTPSQKLPKWFTMPFTMSILTREAIERTGYHVGAKPSWYVANGPHVDIDTEEDFGLARLAFNASRG